MDFGFDLYICNKFKSYVFKIGNVGLAIEAGLGKLFNKYRLLINNLTNVVLPAPSSPWNKQISPTNISLHKFVASFSISRRSKIWLLSLRKFCYAMPFKASTKSVFSQVKCPLSLGSLPKWP